MANKNPTYEEKSEAVLNLSQALRAYVAPEDNDGRIYFSYCFVLSAIKNDHFPAAVNEIINSIALERLPFKNLLRSLFQLSPNTQINWQNVEPLLDHYYNPRAYDKKEKYWQLPKHVAALPQIYRTLQHELKHIQEKKIYFKELHSRLVATAEFCKEQYQQKTGRRPPSARRKYGRPDKPDVRIVEEEKESCFARIFQRTRELCCFNEETVHFYHAYKLVDLFHEKATKDVPRVSNKKKDYKGESIAKAIRRLTEEFVQPLEEILQYSSTSELITVVLRQKSYSENTEKVFRDTLATLNRRPSPGGSGNEKKLVHSHTGRAYPDENEKRLIPVHIGNCMLGAHTYRLMAVRRAAHDDLFVLTKKCQRWMTDIEVATKRIGIMLD